MCVNQRESVLRGNFLIWRSAAGVWKGFGGDGGSAVGWGACCRSDGGRVLDQDGSDRRHVLEQDGLDAFFVLRF